MKILFIGNTRLGDAILSTCILQLFNKKENYITVVCGPISSEIYSSYKSVKTIISIRKKKYSKHWIDVYFQLNKIKWDIIIDLRNTLISRFLKKNNIYRFTKTKNDFHRVEQLCNLFKLKNPSAPKVYVPEIFKKEANVIIKEKKINKNTLAVSPVTNWPRKNWPMKNFTLLIKILLENKALHVSKIIILGDKTEYEKCEKLRKSINSKNVSNLAGQQSILVIHELLKKCKLFIGNDSGLTHLAAASGTLTLSLFGPSKDKYYRPWGKNGFFIRTPKTFEELVHQKGYNRFDDSSLMEGLLVKEVTKKCITILMKK